MAELTDDQLRQLVAQKRAAAAAAAAAMQAPTAPSASMTDDQLRELVAQKRAGTQQGHDQISQEMHPNFDQADRMVEGFLANSPQDTMHYLKGKYPKMDIKLDKESGQVLARDPGEKGFKVLNPDKGVLGNLDPTSGEFYRDALAHAPGFASGLASTAASGVGGVAGGLVGALGGPVGAGAGALAGAATAGGATGAGIDQLRQLLSRHLGVNQENDLGQTAIAGGAGAVAPLLFGTSGVVGPALQDAAPGIAAAVQAGQRGALGYGRDLIAKPVATKLGSTLSGVAPDSLKALSTQLSKFLRLSKDEMGTTTLSEEAAKTTGTALRQVKTDAQKVIDEGIATVPKDTAVDVAPARQIMEKEVAEAEKTAAEHASETNLTRAQQLRKALEDHFYETHEIMDADKGGVLTAVKIPRDTMTLNSAMNLDKDLSALAGLQSIPAGSVKGGIGNRYMPSASRADKMIGQASMDSKEALGAALQKVFPEDVLPKVMAAREQQGTAIATENYLKGANVLGKKPETISKNLRNLSTEANRVKYEKFGQIDSRFGTDLRDNAAMSGALTTFRDPSLVPLSTSGVSAMLRGGIGAGLGSAAGTGVASITGADKKYGALVGGALGSMATSPAMLKQLIIQGTRAGAARQAAGPVPTALGNQFLQHELSPWLQMNNQ